MDLVINGTLHAVLAYAHSADDWPHASFHGVALTSQVVVGKLDADIPIDSKRGLSRAVPACAKGISADAFSTHASRNSAK